jgi:hypothetical protein
VDQLLALLPPRRRGLTNVPTVVSYLTERHTPKGVTHRWTPVTDATFSAAILVVATGAIGLVCVSDED